MASIEQAKELPGVMWEGRNQDIEDIQHLLDDFLIHAIIREPKGTRLSIVLSTDDGKPMMPPLLLNMGDTIVLRKDDPWVPDEHKSDSIGIIRAEAGLT